MLTDNTKVASLLKKTLSTNEENSLAFIIPAVNEFIENYTHRTFEKKTTGEGEQKEDVVETKDYFGKHHRKEIDIDEFIHIDKIESVEVDGDTYEVDPDNYELLPLNTTYKDSMRLIAGTWGGYKYRVTGVLGYSATPPAAIVLIATKLAANLLKGAEGIKKMSIEGFSFELTDIFASDPTMREMLDGYVKVWL